MKTLWIGMLVVALVAVMSLPAMAADFDTADVNLTIEKYCSIEMDGPPLGGPDLVFTPENVVNGYASDSFSYTVKANVDGPGLYTKWEAEVTDGDLAGHCFFAFSAGASPWLNPRYDAIPSGFLKFMHGSMGLGSRLFLFGIELTDDADAYIGKVIGTMTLTVHILGEGETIPDSVPVDVSAWIP